MVMDTARIVFEFNVCWQHNLGCLVSVRRIDNLECLRSLLSVFSVVILTVLVFQIAVKNMVEGEHWMRSKCC